MERTPSFLKWLASALAGIALFTGLFLLKGNGRATPLPPEITASASPTATNATTERDLHNLLVTVTRDDQRISGGFLIVANKNVTKIHIFNIVPRVVVDTQGDLPIDLATAGFESGSSRVQQALQDASGVKIDGSLVLQRLALAGLVDSVRGIDIVNPSPVRVRIQEHRALTIPAGKVHLDGSRAAAYALARVAKEEPSAQTRRIDIVLRETLAHLPYAEKRMKETLSSLGSLSRTTIPTGDVANYLVSLERKHLWQDAQSTPFATVPSALGGRTKTSWQRFDLAQVMQQVGDFTPSAFVPFTKTSIRVAVSSKSAQDRLSARRDFRNTPFVFVDNGHQSSPKVTQVRVLSAVTPKTIVGLRKALGLKKVEVSYQAKSSSTAARTSGALISGHRIADITVTLGVDYRALHNNKESVN